MRAAAALLAALSLLSAAEEKSPRGLRYPTLTPDGRTVVFAYRGDLWRAPADGSGPAARITIHDEQDTLPRVSPDGKWVAFSSRRNGSYDLFVVPIEGGMPRQVTFHSTMEILSAWSPDGKRLLFASNREPSVYQVDLYEVEVEGGTARRLTRDGGREGSYAPDGKSIVYVRGFNTIYQDNYEGPANYDIYVTGTAGGIPRRVTDTPGNERFPFFSGDGQTIYFLAEEKGVSNFHAVSASGEGRRKLTKLEGDDALRPDLSRDGRTAAFERGGRLCRVDLAAPEPKPVDIPVKVESDVRNSGIESRTITAGGEQAHVSPDGSRIAFTLRGDIWIMPASGGNGTRVTQGPANDQWPRFSPDGRFLSYSSDARGPSDLFLLDLQNGRARPLTSNPANDFFQAWSPDGTRLVFSSERSGNRDLFTVEVESGKETQLTNHPAPDDDPVYSPDGKWIAFDSGREGGQAIFVMRADGSAPRRVTQGAGFFQVPSFSPDGSMIAFEAFNPQTAASEGLFVVSASGGPHMQIARDGQGACFGPKGDTIYFHADRGSDAGVYRVRAPEAVEAGERVPFVGRIEIDRRQELAMLFDEAWTRLKEGFYDPRMHGVDWDQMRRKYRDMAVDTENKDEFYNVVSQMLAELGASHLGIAGGPERGGPRGPETGQVGIDFEFAPAEGGGRQVAKVMRGGPGDQSGARVGDVVTALNGTRLDPATDLDKLLAGTVGREIEMTFRPLSSQGLGAERTAKITPVSWMQVRELQYRNWVQGNDEATKRLSKNVAGYVHLDQMNPQNLDRFQQAVARFNQDPMVKGMVLDVRENGGGNIHVQLMEILTARPFLEIGVRGQPQRFKQPQLYWDRPVVLLVNERSFSDAEVFPWIFRWRKVGKVVGVGTARGVIGTNDVTLADGSTLRIPRSGMYALDGTNLEGKGCEPDILVVETAEDRAQGRDPQLEKAVEVLLQEIAAREPAAAPAAAPPPPPAPPQPQPATPSVPPVPPPPPAPNPADSADEHPLGDATSGEWTVYAVAGAGETQVRVTVDRIAEGTIHFRVERIRGEGEIPPFPAQVKAAPLREVLPAFGRVGRLAKGTRHDGSGTRSYLVVELTRPDGNPVEMVFTNAIPALGLEEVRERGRVVLSAIDWSGRPKAPAPGGH